MRAAQPGTDLTLSIDRRIQYLAYRELKRALLETSASVAARWWCSTSQTGEVLAMVNLPSFNPERASTAASRDAHRNRAVTDVVEPGSTMKPFTVAAALDRGVVTPHTTIDTNPGLDARTAAIARPTRTTTAC